MRVACEQLLVDAATDVLVETSATSVKIAMSAILFM
jgi:hypothetical protein